MGKKILIVDDEADIREILAFNLSAAGYETLEAGTLSPPSFKSAKGWN